MGNYYRPHPNTQEILDRIMEEIEHEGDYTLRGKPDMRLDLRDRLEKILTAQEGESFVMIECPNCGDRFEYTPPKEDK